MFSLRERSQSEGEVLLVGKKRTGEHVEDMDISVGHSTCSVPTASLSTGYKSKSGAGHKRRLLQKSKKQELEDSPFSLISQDQKNAPRGAKYENRVASKLGRQPTIEEPPPSPTLAEIVHQSNVSLSYHQL